MSGASVCPMKMLAATFNASAPLAFMKRRMAMAKRRTTNCITPR